MGEYFAPRRSQVVLATKFSLTRTYVNGVQEPGPNAGGNHRKSLVENLDASLKRMQMGYVDVQAEGPPEFEPPSEMEVAAGRGEPAPLPAVPEEEAVVSADAPEAPRPAEDASRRPSIA